MGDLSKPSKSDEVIRGEVHLPATRDSEQTSPIPQGKRPSYLEASVNLGFGSRTFDIAVIKQLEPEFNEFADPEDEQGYEHIKTYLRIRPIVKKEEKDVDFLDILDDTKVLANHIGVNGGGRSKGGRKTQFKFTRVLNPACGQEEVYEQAVAPLLEKFNAGDSCLVFSYGATNSGKTYTMRGSSTKYGIIPRTIYRLFEQYQERIYRGADIQPFRHESTRQLGPEQQRILLDRKKALIASAYEKNQGRKRVVRPPEGRSEMSMVSQCQSIRCVGLGEPRRECDSLSPDSHTTVFGIFVSMVELHNEKCIDLYGTGKGGELKLVSEKGGYAHFKDVTEIPVFNEDEAYALYAAGCRKLEIASTQVNAHSSRSHSFFVIRIVELGQTKAGVYPIKIRRMCFCDLAGNERVCQTENTGGLLRESNNINSSLMSLLRVIRMIREKQGKGEKEGFLEGIPFRDSKLTRIFESYLSSSTHIAMLVCVNPTLKMADSSMQTLINSAIASSVVTYRRRQSIVVESLKYNNSCLNSSLDLEDVIEEEEEEEDEEEDGQQENRPPIILPEVGPALPFNIPAPSEASSQSSAPAMHHRNHYPTNHNQYMPPPPPPGAASRKPPVRPAPAPPGVLRENNKNKTGNANFKKPLPPSTQYRTEEEYQALKLEIERLHEIIYESKLEINRRGKRIEDLTELLTNMEYEVREQILKELRGTMLTPTASRTAEAFLSEPHSSHRILP